MGVAHDVARSLGQAFREVRSSHAKLASNKVASGMPRQLTVTSPSFRDESPLPHWCAAEGGGTPPLIEWSAVPPGTQSVVIMCEDPDAPLPEPFVHWIVYGIAPTGGITDPRLVTQGRNSRLAVGFVPPTPPIGHGTHHYHFQVFAIDRRIDGPEVIGRTELIGRLRGHVLAWGEIVGTYRRD